jgi:hypothetical protein
MADIMGVEVADLPENFYATGVVMILRGVSMDDGLPFTATRISSNVSPAEIVGLSWTLHEDSKHEIAVGLHEEFPGVQFVVVDGVTQVVLYHDDNAPGGTS